MVLRAHLHSETRTLPMEDSLRFLCRQYLTSALCPSHPPHAIVAQTYASASKKIPYSPNTGSPWDHFSRTTIQPPMKPKKNTKQYPHQGSSGRDPKKSNKPCPTWTSTRNKPWGSHAPKSLPARPIAVRSEHSIALNGDRAAIALTSDHSCPASDIGEPHTVLHLFSCPALRTELVARDLWEGPVLKAHFLSSIPSFHHFSARRRTGLDASQQQQLCFTLSSIP